jgi:surfactin synthase thioesterase subunit
VAAPAGDGGTWIRRFRPPAQGDAVMPCGPAAEGTRTQDAGGQGAGGKPAVRLVCFPHAGGSASFYFPLARSLPADVDVLAVQYPGRQDRRADQPIEDIGELADRICAALAPWTGRPMAFLGHSMGAVVGYEAARRLEQETGTRLTAFFASGRRAPSRRPGESAVQLRDDDAVLAELGRLSGTDEALLGDEELVRMILPPLRSDYRALRNYTHRPGPKLSCPITVLVGDADPYITLDEARAWREHTAGGFALRVFPGDHFFISSQRAAVSSVIRERLCAGGAVLHDRGNLFEDADPAGLFRSAGGRLGA